MNLTETNLAQVVIVDATVNADQRGYFSRLFCQNALESVLGARTIVQINHSCTHRIGAVRGLHYQVGQHAEMKLVRCLRGKVWDVAVDLRAGSPTFLEWHAEELSPGQNNMLVIPEGCAHGFQVLESDSELLYLHTAAYEPSAEGGIQPMDPLVNISWPLVIEDLSTRDQQHPTLDANFSGLAL